MFFFLNGQIVPEEQAVVSVQDRSFLYGDGLFETIPIYSGRPFRWAQHLERLTRGAEYLKIRLPYTPKELRRSAAELLARNEMTNAILRLTLSRGVGERGYLPGSADQPTVVMALHPLPTENFQDPEHWQIITSAHRIPTADPLSSFKTNCKLPQILASAEADAAGADDALLINNNGEVTETSRANIFWVYRDTIYATPSGRGAVPGITRAVVLELCQALALPANKKVIKPESLRNAQAVFLSLSSRGIVSVTSLDGEPVGDSPLVEQLRQAYWDVVAKS